MQKTSDQSECPSSLLPVSARWSLNMVAGRIMAALCWGLSLLTSIIGVVLAASALGPIWEAKSPTDILAPPRSSSLWFGGLLDLRR